MIKTLILALTLALAAVTAAANTPSADQVALPTPVPPVIIATQCSSTGCWLHFADGTSRFVSKP